MLLTPPRPKPPRTRLSAGGSHTPLPPMANLGLLANPRKPPAPDGGGSAGVAAGARGNASPMGEVRKGHTVLRQAVPVRRERGGGCLRCRRGLRGSGRGCRRGAAAACGERRPERSSRSTAPTRGSLRTNCWWPWISVCMRSTLSVDPVKTIRRAWKLAKTRPALEPAHASGGRRGLLSLAYRPWGCETRADVSPRTRPAGDSTTASGTLAGTEPPARGSRTSKVAPGPGSTQTVPWCAVTMAATMASPSPPRPRTGLATDPIGRMARRSSTHPLVRPPGRRRARGSRQTHPLRPRSARSGNPPGRGSRH